MATAHLIAANNKPEMKLREKPSIYNKIKYNKIFRNKFSKINAGIINRNSQIIAQRNKLGCSWKGLPVMETENCIMTF